MPRRVEYFDDPDAQRANSLVVAVTAVVVNDAGNVLLKRSGYNRWRLPGGPMNIRENIGMAIVREVKGRQPRSVHSASWASILSLATSSPTQTAKCDTSCRSASGHGSSAVGSLRRVQEASACLNARAVAPYYRRA
jgi:hypothetical protein